MQWAHSRVSAASTRTIMGPSKAICSSHCKCNWPILGIGSKIIVGPIKTIGSNSRCKSVGSSCIIGSILLGQSVAIGSISLDYGGRPTCNIRPLSHNGPTWLFLIYMTILHLGCTNYYDQNLLHYVKKKGKGDESQRSGKCADC